MATAATAAKKARQSALPKSATIIIHHGQPDPCGEVEVTPDNGRIIFENKDKKEYRLRIWRLKTDSASEGLDLLLPASGRLTVLIRKNDEFAYSVKPVEATEAMNGAGGGPIRN